MTLQIICLGIISNLLPNDVCKGEKSQQWVEAQSKSVGSGSFHRRRPLAQQQEASTKPHLQNSNASFLAH